MPDRDTHVRTMVGDLVLRVAQLQAENDVLVEALTNDTVRADLAARVAELRRQTEPAAAVSTLKG